MKNNYFRKLLSLTVSLLILGISMSGCGKHSEEKTMPEKTDAPVSFNTAILYNEQHSSYDEKSEDRRNEILNTTDTIKPSQSGVTYYISYKGSDENNGTSAETPWRSAARLGMSSDTINEGDVVLFERGGLYRGCFTLSSGVSYGAYGEGCKPNIYGSLRDYAFEELWESADEENVWKLDVGDMSDIGNIVFNHGEKCGIKKLKNQLRNNTDYYHDTENGVLYLYLSDGNPGGLYYDIEICSDDPIAMGYGNTHDVKIENLCLKYTGGHGICFTNGAKKITVTGCEIGYIGGSMLAGANVRYGNGFETVDNCENITVTNNWVYQCFDAGITHQSSYQPGCVQKGIDFSDNLIEYCNYNIEYYVSVENGRIENTVYKNNILRFAGHGFGSINRIGSDTGVSANICNYVRSMPSTGFSIEGNILDSPQYYQTTIGCPNDTVNNLGPVIKGNTYIQKNNSFAIYLNKGTIRKTLYAKDLDELKADIKLIDSAPIDISYEK